MPPRGRPPGRKNNASLGVVSQPSAAFTTPTSSRKTPTGTPRTNTARRGRPGRPPRGKARRQSSLASEIRVALPAASSLADATEPVVAKSVTTRDPVANINDSNTPAHSKKTAKDGLTNGSASYVRLPSPRPNSRDADELTITDDTIEPSPAPVVGPRPRGRPPNSANRAGARNHALTYASLSVDLEEITYRQLGEDIEAYLADLDFCQSQLSLGKEKDLTPQEARALQLRVLDLNHQVRNCEHRREIMEKQRLISGGRSFNSRVPASGPPCSTWPGTSGGGRSAPASTLKRPLSPNAAEQHNLDSGARKRTRAQSEVSIQDTISMHSQDQENARENSHSPTRDASDIEIVQYSGRHNVVTSPERQLFGTAEGNHPGTKIQRLGLWYCQLCVSEKYMYAGPNRVPSNPSKEIKDMGKLMTHYFDLHKEHTPEERLYALGEALHKNRGPFAYWLIKSRSQRVDDPSIMDDAISELKAGRVPRLLRDLCRAAAAFPGTTTN